MEIQVCVNENQVIKIAWPYLIQYTQCVAAVTVSEWHKAYSQTLKGSMLYSFNINLTFCLY